MNNDLDKKIKDAVSQCRGYSSNKIFQYIYPFTTENINGYIDLFYLDDKSLLTVGSSGDQVINAIDKGCKNIDVVDINEYTKYYYFLMYFGINK